MQHLRALSRLVNCPLLLDNTKLDIINTEVISKLLSGVSLSEGSPTPHNEPQTPVSKKTGTIKVFDSLVSKGGAGSSGFTSYESITRQSLELINNGATHLVYYFDSPGGEVSGLFGAAEHIAALPATYGVTTEAVVDGRATSAAYLLASATQKISATSTSMLGSIAAIMTLVDLTASDAKAGAKYTILRSKEEKALANPHEETSDKAISDAKATLSIIDKELNSAVTKFRPSVSLQTIIDLKGNTVLGNEALSLNLVDEIVTSANDVFNSQSKKTSSTNIGANMDTLEELKAKVQSQALELSTLKTGNEAALQTAIASAVASERDRVLAVLEAGTTLSIPAATVMKRIKAGTSKEDCIDLFEDIKESMQSTTSLNTTGQGDVIIPASVVEAAGATQDFSVASLMSAIDKLDKGVAA